MAISNIGSSAFPIDVSQKHYFFFAQTDDHSTLTPIPVVTVCLA